MERKKNYKLKGHETFCIREGWLSKGLHAVVENDRVFGEMYGADALGVGSNMAKAIRYWLKAAGLTVEEKGKGVALTEFGRLIYEKDPYLEEDFTLWCIHLNLVKNKEYATSWYLFFHLFQLEEFTKEEMEEFLERELEKYIATKDFSTRSLKDDCTVLLQMYARETGEEPDPEDKKICPLTVLGILRKSGNYYKRTQPDYNRFSAYVVLYLLESLWQKQDAISMEEFYSEAMGVHATLGIGFSAYQECLETLVKEGYVDMNRTAGLDMIYRLQKKSINEILKGYYK